jgi:hypothetical protein
MISVICVYNKHDVLDRVLMAGLLRQSERYELITIDNTHDTSGHVAEVLNRAAEQATGKYLMFIHQDVELISPNWLRDVERALDGIPDLGVAGVAGADCAGGDDFDSHLVGHIKSGNQEWGKELAGPVKVQTVDELLVIMPRAIFAQQKFDAARFDFIHLFAADYSLSVARLGLGAYVIPGYVHHTSTGNFYGIDKYRIRLYAKHRDASPIFTTCGVISLSSIPKYIVLSAIPKSWGISLRNMRNKLIKRATDARGGNAPQ